MKRKWFNVLRVLLCMVLMTLIYIYQTAFGARMTIFGGHFDLLPVMIAAVGMSMGSTAGLVCGLYAGVLYDVSAGIEGIYPMYYMFWGILCGYLGTRVPRFRSIVTAVCAIGMEAVLFLLRYLFYFQFESNAGLGTFSHHIILHIVLTLIAAPIVYRLMTWISRRGNKRSVRPEV